MARNKNSRLVYSTGTTFGTCPKCNKQFRKCRCDEQSDSRPETDGVVRVRPEKKGRGGKVATTISGLPGTEKEIKAIAKKLKKKCGVGGSFKDWVVIIQGDQVDTVVAELQKMGFDAKRSGG